MVVLFIYRQLIYCRLITSELLFVVWFVSWSKSNRFLWSFFLIFQIFVYSNVLKYRDLRAWFELENISIIVQRSGCNNAAAYHAALKFYRQFFFHPRSWAWFIDPCFETNFVLWSTIALNNVMTNRRTDSRVVWNFTVEFRSPFCARRDGAESAIQQCRQQRRNADSPSQIHSRHRRGTTRGRGRMLEVSKLFVRRLSAKSA